MVPNEDVVQALRAWKKRYPTKSSMLVDYVATAAASTDAPLVYHPFAFLAELASLVPSHVELRTSFGAVRPIVWSLLVGDSGARKSVSAAMAADLFDAAGQGKYQGPTPISLEALVTSLAKRPTQTILYSEFGDFLNQTFEGKGQRRLGPLREKMTDLFDGRPIDVAYRKKRDSIQVRRHRMSLLGASSESYLNQYTSGQDWTGGFMGRFFIARGRVEEQRSIRAEAHPYWTVLAARIHYAAQDTVGVCTGLDAAAARHLKRWVAQERVRVAGLNVGRKRYLTAALNRLDVAAMRLALLLAWDFGEARRAAKWKVRKPEMALACALLQLHVTSYASIIDILAENKTEAIMGAVRLVLEEEPVASWRKLLQDVQPRQRSRDLKQIIETMVEAGDIVTFMNDSGDDFWALSREDVPVEFRDDLDDDEEEVAETEEAYVEPPEPPQKDDAPLDMIIMG